VEEIPAQNPEQQLPPTEDPSEDSPKKRSVPKQLLIGGAVFAFLLTFLLGFLIRGQVRGPQKETILPTPIPLVTEKATATTPSPKQSELPQETIRFLPGKGYYDDSISIITKSNPRIILQASASRIEQETNYTEFSKVNVFDGKEWTQQILTGTVYDTNVGKNTLIQEWMTNFQGSTSSNNSPTISVKIATKQHTVAFASSTIFNELSTQSKPNYTKFIYQGSGRLSLDNDQYDAYVVYSRTYSVNAADLAFFNKPEALKTAWVAFWAEDGSFYHVDSLDTNNVGRSIASYSLGLADGNNQVLKTPSVTTKSGTQAEINAYEVSFGNPINRTLNGVFTQKLIKSAKSNYNWVFGPIEGSLLYDRDTQFQGIGLAEYIN